MSYQFGATINRDVYINDKVSGKFKIFKGEHVLLFNNEYKTKHHTSQLVRYRNNKHIHIKTEYLDFDIPRKLYILSNSNDGTKDINGEYMLIDDCGVILYQQHCSAKKFAKKDLIIGNSERLKSCSKRYGGNYKILFLGEDEMTAERILQIYRDYHSKE